MRAHVLLVSVGLCGGLLAGCAAPPAPEAPGVEMAQGVIAARRAWPGQPSAPGPSAVPRVVIRDADLRLEVKDVEAAIERIRALAVELGGYALSVSMEEVTIKVPAGRLDEAMGRIGALGKVTARSVTARDVTAEYQDLEARLKNALATRQQYQELLEKAASVKEILAVEKELTRIQELIERLQGRLNLLRSRTALSRLHVSVALRRTPGPLMILYRGVAWVFRRLVYLTG